MKVRWAAIIVVFLITISLCEFVSRYFVSRNFNTPYWEPSRIIYVFYPELLSLPEKLEKGKINILILGGSAITDTLCHTSENLNRELSSKGIQANIYNLAQFAHNTLDARIKFKHCKDLGFDYVFVYNAINDTRTNNCPDEVFCDNYSHIQFYSQVDAFERHPEIRYLTLPFVIDYYLNEAKIKIGWKKTIPPEYFVVNWKLIGNDTTTEASTSKENIQAMLQFVSSNQDKIIGSDLKVVDSVWWSEGKNIKSRKSFRNNLEYIYNNKPQITNLVLTDYAWYQPANYSLKTFLYQKLDYAEQRWPTELYGKPENVTKGLKMHNQIIDSIALAHPDIIHFDFNDSIPHTGVYFNDICHLADSGQTLLGHILADQIIRHLKTKGK